MLRATRYTRSQHILVPLAKGGRSSSVSTSTAASPSSGTILRRTTEAASTARSARATERQLCTPQRAALSASAKSSSCPSTCSRSSGRPTQRPSGVVGYSGSLLTKGLVSTADGAGRPHATHPDLSQYVGPRAAKWLNLTCTALWWLGRSQGILL